MSFEGSSILKDGTVATTGGTAKTIAKLSNFGSTFTGYFDGTDFLSRINLMATAKAPKISSSSPDGYTQMRNTISLKMPFVLASGETTIVTLRMEQSSSVEMSAAEKKTLRVYGAQLLTEAAYDEYWDNQGVA